MHLNTPWSNQSLIIEKVKLSIHIIYFKLNLINDSTKDKAHKW